MSKNTTSHHQRRKRQLLARDGVRVRVSPYWGYIDQYKYVYHCYLCTKPFPPDQLRIEHKLPKSRGGTDHLDNLGLACETCDSEKANMTVAEYREYKEMLRVTRPGNAPTIRKALITDIWKGNLTYALSDYWPDKPDGSSGRNH